MRPRSALACLLLLSQPALAGGVAVGNGGDVVERYLEATRYILREAYTKIQAGDATSTLCVCSEASDHSACATLGALTPDQQAQCREILMATAAGVQALAAAPLPLTLSSTPLYGTDACGNRVEVAAQTDPGPAGPIVYGYDRIRSSSPMDLLAVTAREITQKVAYPLAGQYVLDPALLDGVGAAVAWYAYEKKLVGLAFQLVDTYACEVSEQTTGIDFSSLGASLRLFNGDTDSYETGVGNTPTDLACSLRDTTGSQLTFRVKIHEEDGCAPAAVGTRYTSLELWRVTDPVPPAAAPPAQRLEYKLVDNWNPLCPAAAGAPAPPPLSLEHKDTGRDYLFQVKYEGSTGRAGPTASMSDSGYSP